MMAPSVAASASTSARTHWLGYFGSRWLPLRVHLILIPCFQGQAHYPGTLSVYLTLVHLAVVQKDTLRLGVEKLVGGGVSRPLNVAQGLADAARHLGR